MGEQILVKKSPYYGSEGLGSGVHPKLCVNL